MTTSEKIDGIPEGLRKSVRQGFQRFANLPVATRNQVFDRIASTIGSAASNIDLDPIIDATGMDRDDAGYIVNAFSVSIALASDDGVKLDDFLDAARGKLYDKDVEPAASEVFGRIIEDASSWQGRIERRTMAVETLPAFMSFDTSIDLRLRFEKERIVDAVPVLLVHLDTDTNEQEIWFQATRGDVTLLIERLTKVAREMDAAEALYRSQPKS